MTFLSPPFFKKASGILQSPLSVTLSPPKPLDEIQPNLVCVCVAHMNGVCNGTFVFGPAPWGLGEGPKGQISLSIIKFQLQSQLHRFLNPMCVSSHK